jgi:hypothetical protein
VLVVDADEDNACAVLAISELGTDSEAGHKIDGVVENILKDAGGKSK